MLITITVALALAASSGTPAPSWSTGLSAGTTLSESLAAPIVGFHAPDFTLQTADNRSISLSNYRGDVVLLNFFASWCQPCQDEMPVFVKAAPLLAPFHIDFLGVDMSEDEFMLGKFAKRYSATTYPLVLDQAGDEAKAFGFRAIPTTLVIDQDGIIAYRLSGELDGKDLSDILKTVSEHREGDAMADEDVVRTERFDITSGPDVGLLTVNIMGDSHGTLGIRLSEKWKLAGTVASDVGTVAADGRLDFGSQFLPPLSRLLLPYFASGFVHIANANSTVSSVVGDIVTSSHFAISAQDDASDAMTVSERMTTAHTSGSAEGYSASGTVLYSSAKKGPVSGAFAVIPGGQEATGGNYTFTIRTKPG